MSSGMRCRADRSERERRRKRSSLRCTLMRRRWSSVVTSQVKQITADVSTERRLPLGGPWRVAYDNESAEPIDLPHVWEVQPGRQHYSGPATYTTSIDLGVVDGRVSIDFGDCEVREGASTEHDMVGPAYRVAVRGPFGRPTLTPLAFR
jgi:hypothetical protein